MLAHSLCSNLILRFIRIRSDVMMAPMKKFNIQQHRNRESGNVFMFILMGVVLFAALSFTVSRGFQGENTSRMSNREAVLAASDILSYVQRLERGLSKIRRKNVSENDIRLDYDTGSATGYENAGCSADRCRVFSISGGGVRWQSPPDGAASGTWIFTGSTCIADIGSGATGCDGDGVSNEELIVILPDVASNLCDALNDRLNISAPPTDSGGGYSATKFTGAFTDGTELILGNTYRRACYSDGTDLHFYAVILER